ncbi:hypothetical protein [Desulfovibrio piger]|uniref:hypothetical protein n=1 Tax=Desulfovibrio piger TaxID=901 RepID=UPI0026F074D2|nr:hypothetical protein [Desulfovibrio piger]
MLIKDPQPTQRDKLLDSLKGYTQHLGTPVFIKYLDLGTKVVRLINYSHAFTPFVEDQLAYILKDDMPSYDATLIIWHEKDMAELLLAIYKRYDMRAYIQIRAARLREQKTGVHDSTIELRVYDEESLHRHPLININAGTGLASAFDPRTNTYYYSASDLSPEEFIKHGHLFVHTLSKILKSPTSNLGHGAVIGLNGIGVLFCGVGYRGKSTFAVNALLHGFEYVSDDYISFGKKNETLLAWPIYSIITLSPMIWQFMKRRLHADFISNNGRKDKYVFSIARYHNQFVSGYPIKLCIYPRFVQDAEPSIDTGEKSQALEEFVLSSLRQTGDAEDVEAIAKLYSFVKDLPYYRINLTANLDKNTQCLKEFLEKMSNHAS